ncbi:helix-turn-helix domain-containing protein [Oceanobacillus damuensis]|uniref:helix-turn-helix domain-containing protein n=1 Tax=Oceanobacillus damuensis TaxID=937928 RepID=UPI00083345A3|nr:helix-turn-helix domain-containing protein [Oceanobacillus damuensis]
MKYFRGEYLIKMLLILGGSVVFIFLLVFFSFYIKTANYLEREAIDNSVEIINQVKDRLQNELNQVEKRATEIVLNQDVIESIYDRELENNNEKIFSISKSLNQFSQTINQIQSVELFIPGSSLLISTANGVDTLDKFSDNKRQFYQTVEALRKTTWNINSVNNTISYVQPLPVISNFPQGYFTINLNQAFLTESLESYYLVEESNYQIIKSNGNVLFHKKEENASLFVDNTQFLSMLNHTDPVGFLIDERNQVILFHAKIHSGEWLILYEVPFESLFYKKNDFMQSLNLTALIVLLIALLVVFCASIYLYSPLRQLVKGLSVKKRKGLIKEWALLASTISNMNEKVKNINKELIESRKYNFEAFLSKWLFTDLNVNELNNYLDEVGIDPSYNYIVLVIEYEKVEKDSVFLVHEKAGDVISGCLSQYNLYPFFLPLQERLVVLLPIPKREKHIQDKQKLIDLVNTAHQVINKHLKIQSSIGIGTLTESADEIKTSFLNAEEALRFRLNKGMNQVISYDEMQYTKFLIYPYHIEESILKGVKNNNQEIALTELNNFIKFIRKQTYNYKSIYHAFTMLYISLYRILDENCKDDKVKIKHDFHNQLFEKKTLNDIKKMFEKDILPGFFDKIMEQSENSGVNTINSVKRFLMDNVTEPLTLGEVANHFDINPSYLSRLFKKLTGQSFVEYFSAIKIEKSKDMLKNTKYSIYEIAENVGYTERTFGRVFKKVTGVTPSNYRLERKG